jgi:hypothetical protein
MCFVHLSLFSVVGSSRPHQLRIVLRKSISNRDGALPWVRFGVTTHNLVPRALPGIKHLAGVFFHSFPVIPDSYNLGIMGNLRKKVGCFQSGKCPHEWSFCFPKHLAFCGWKTSLNEVVPCKYWNKYPHKVKLRWARIPIMQTWMHHF